jgi:uncharacterized cupin superfamily protein
MGDGPPVVNLEEIALDEFGHGEKFAARLGRVGRQLGMQKIGCGLVVLAPGKRAWPFHGHYAQEEAFVILAGSGVIRYGEGEYPVKAGDVIFTPPGPDRAHQIVNDSEDELKYLALSSMDSPEICYYPDSGKTGAFHVTAGGFAGFMSRESDQADYWEGED